MKKLTLLMYLMMTVVTFFGPVIACGQIQPVKKWIFYVGPSIAFATKSIGRNEAGIGVSGGVEKNIYKTLSIDAETGFLYFIGDNAYVMGGKNKAYTIPLLAGMKTYFFPQVYIEPKIGGIYFLLNDASRAHVKLAYGIAGGINLSKKNNRINIRTAYTSFRYHAVQRGYATLAAAIIIN